VPDAEKVAATPLTVQMSGVSEAKLTGSPELAVATSATVAPTVWLGMASNVMTCADRCLGEMIPLQPLKITVLRMKVGKELRKERNGLNVNSPEQAFPGNKDDEWCN